MCKYCIEKSVKFIEVYQDTISPDHSAWWKTRYPWWYCRYTPTCSEYTKLAIKKDWFLKGCLKWFWRVLRCNPWSKWWIDNP